MQNNFIILYRDHFSHLTHSLIDRLVRDEEYHTLIKGHTHPNQLDTDGNTPLHQGVSFGVPEGIRIWLQHPNTNPNQFDNDGLTALHRAARDNLREMVTTLLADPRVDPRVLSGDDDPVTAHDLALAHGHHAIAALLPDAHRINPLSYHSDSETSVSSNR